MTQRYKLHLLSDEASMAVANVISKCNVNKTVFQREISVQKN
jgi:hypothetical protein